MTRSELERLQAELATVRRMHAATPVEDAIDRGSLNARLEELEHMIANAGAQGRAPARVRLTFRGKPVVGSHGIFVGFGQDAVKRYSEAVAMIASSEEEALKAAGRIPNKRELLITSTAIGSFGFELEEHVEDELPMDESSPTARAMDQLADVLLATQEGTDDDLADSLLDTDPRAVEKIRSFLDLLVSKEAVVNLIQDNRTVRFTQVAKVAEAKERLGEKNIHEDTQEFTGQVSGLILSKRWFEFKTDGSEETIVGKIAKDLKDASHIDSNLHRSARVRLRVTRAGQGRPKYLMNELPVW